jgi:hypothetical protein
MRKFACLWAFALSCAWTADRPDLNGTWQLDPAHTSLAEKTPKAETLSIKQKEDSIEIATNTTESNGKEARLDVACNTLGQQCNVKQNGQATQVSFWYNGPVLVMLEQRHGNDFVVKRLLRPAEDGKSLSIEVSYLAPPGHKPETYTFTRQ